MKGKSCYDKWTNIKINGILFESFEIEKKVKQVCSLASYLFFIIAEVLNAMIMIEAKNEVTKRNQLLIANKQQIMG